jgi:hypothetical protein
MFGYYITLQRYLLYLPLLPRPVLALLRGGKHGGVAQWLEQSAHN